MVLQPAACGLPYNAAVPNHNGSAMLTISRHALQHQLDTCPARLTCVRLAGTPESRVAAAEPSEAAVALAASAVHAWGCYVELLGASFLTRDPPVGQPMLKVGRFLGSRG